MVGADYDKIKKFKKIDAKMDTNLDPNIDAWTIRGSTFQVVGGFLRCLIFVILTGSAIVAGKLGGSATIFLFF